MAGFRDILRSYRAKKTAQLNGRTLKDLLRRFKEERDRIERETGRRPEIDDTTRMYMQKVLNVWISEGRKIDEERFWQEVDHNRQFSHPVEFYELGNDR